MLKLDTTKIMVLKISFKMFLTCGAKYFSVLRRAIGVLKSTNSK